MTEATHQVSTTSTDSDENPAATAGLVGRSTGPEIRISASDGRPVVYGVRPEHFTIADDGAEAEIIVVEPTGSETQVFAKLGGEQVVAVFRERHQFNPGDKVRLKPDPSLVHLFDEATGKRLNA